MTEEQLALFGVDETPVLAVGVAQVCHFCGERVELERQDDGASPWGPMPEWLLVAQRQHEREHHGTPLLETQ